MDSIIHLLNSWTRICNHSCSFLVSIVCILSLLQLCDSHAKVTCVDLDLYNQKGIEESVCMQCPNGYTGDGQQCRGSVICFNFSFTVLSTVHGNAVMMGDYFV